MNQSERQVELDISSLRKFADEIMDEYNNYVKTEAKEITRLIAGEGGSTTQDRLGANADPNQTLGAEGGEYAGKALGGLYAENATTGLRWVQRMVEGFEAASLGTAVYAEELEATDSQSSAELSRAETIPPPA